MNKVTSEFRIFLSSGLSLFKSASFSHTPSPASVVQTAGLPREIQLAEYFNGGELTTNYNTNSFHKDVVYFAQQLLP